MDTTIETSRLILRAIVKQDFRDFLEYATDKEVMKYISPIGSLNEIRENFAGYLKPWSGEEGQWMAAAVILKETNQLIGDIGFRYKSKEHQQIEIGYKFNRNFQDKGFGTEAVTEMVNLIVSDWPFHKLVAYCDPRNVASFKIMERFGMQQEGLFKEHYKFGDEWQDELAFGVLKRNIQIR